MMKEAANPENLSFNTEITVEGERNDHITEEKEEKETAQSALANIEKTQVTDGKGNAESSRIEIEKAEDIGIQGRSLGKEEIVQDNIQEIDPTEQNQQEYVQIDPDNPSEVHAYLMQLYADKKLDPPIRPHEFGGIPVKEWMEKCYPHIFKVFPQNLSDGIGLTSREEDLLFFNYWLFLDELHNILRILHSHVTAGYVELSLKVITGLESKGFDCRFMKSEMVVVADKLKRQHDLLVVEKLEIETKIARLKNAFGEAATKKPCYTSKKMTVKSPVEDNNFGTKGTLDMLPSKTVDEQVDNSVIDTQLKILACKEEELRRLAQVLQEINKLRQGNATSSSACSGTYH